MSDRNGGGLSLSAVAVILAVVAILAAAGVGVALMIHTSRTTHTGTELRLNALEHELELVRAEEVRLRDELAAHERSDLAIHEGVRVERPPNGKP